MTDKLKIRTLEESCAWHYISIHNPESAPQNRCVYCDSYDKQCLYYKPQKHTQIPVRRGVYAK